MAHTTLRGNGMVLGVVNNPSNGFGFLDNPAKYSSLGVLSQETKLKNKKYKNVDIISLFMNFTERDSFP